MSLPLYSDLLSPPVHSNSFANEVAEPQSRYRLLTERHLQAMWLEQKYFYPLETREGQKIQVISPGIWNSGPGPDFFKAHLKIGDREVRGDVELHLCDDGWYQHKHHLDDNYNDVILHISYWSPKHARPLLTANSNKIPCTYLDKFLTIPEARIINLIDLDLYPYIHFSGSGTCASSLFKTLSEEEITSFFRSASEWRLIQKKNALTARSNNGQLDIALGMAIVLGYKNNSEVFAQLYNEMISKAFDSEKDRFAFALGRCGFFEDKYQARWNLSDDYQELRDLYTSKYHLEKLPPLILKQHKIRPPSHPVRRLAALTKITCDENFHLLEAHLLQLWNREWRSLTIKKNQQLFRQQLYSLLPSYHDDYWEHHYAFELKRQTKAIAFIGDDLKQELVVNVLLPWLYNHLKDRPEELTAFLNFYGVLSSPITHKGVYLQHRFFGNTSSGKVLKKTDIQQGAYQLHRDFCIHFEASCQGCPFVERYKKVFH